MLTVCLLAATSVGAGVRPHDRSETSTPDCAARAAYLYVQAIGHAVPYREIEQMLPPGEGGVSVSTVIQQLRALAARGRGTGSEVSAGAVSVENVRRAQRPMIVLFPGESRVVERGGHALLVGHYVVAIPAGGEAVLLDPTLERAERLGWAQVWRRAGLQESDPIVVISQELSLQADAAFLEGYERRVKQAAAASESKQLDLGSVRAPEAGEVTSLTLDIAPHAVGDDVQFSFRIEEDGTGAFTLAKGESTCSCAGLVWNAGPVAPGEGALVSGRVQVRAGMGGAKIERTTVRVVRQAGEGVVQVDVVGTPKVRAEVWPPVISLGRLPVGVGGSGKTSIELDRPRRLVLQEAKGLEARLTAGPSNDRWEVEVSVGRGAVGDEGKVVVGDENDPALVIEVPVQWGRRETREAEPREMAITPDGGWRRAAFRDGRAAVRVESSEWLETKLEEDGSALVRVRQGMLRRLGYVRLVCAKGETAMVTVLRVVSRGDR